MSVISTVLAAAAATACTVTSPSHTVALVELYTSQGCSSCPPADRWLSELPRRLPATRAVPLALHVGYWDYIGWKDPFAQREFNQRQRQLADLNRSRTVYTPGVFVNGREFDWRDQQAFSREIAAINRQPAAATITLSAVVDGAAVEVEVEARVQPGTAATGTAPALFLALKQNGHRTAVSRGENRGETLRNDHVVRGWRGPLASGGRVALTLPADGPREFALVALAQDGSGRLLQSVVLPLSACLSAR